ncbi:MAG: hypothetical protein M1812_000271 [Candelaria pacifica]|nr:MAG: hypothetical protein M1812_000271 [Candelaria pacifica]
MSSERDGRQALSESSMTIPSDSENYSAGNGLSPSPPSSSSSPMILYSPPTIWGLLRGAAINLFLPFVNGLMLGFGELLAHEAAFRLGWSGTKSSIVNIRCQSSKTQGPPSLPINLSCTPWRRRTYNPTSSAILTPSRRHKSTALNIPPAPESQSSSIISEPLLSTSLDDGFDIAEPSATNITAHIGYLKELGLDYGWGPTACIEWLLEHIHVYAGTPWWASIVITATGIRILLMKPYLAAADTSARLASVKHIMKPITDRMKEAQRAGNMFAMQECKLELKRITRRAEIKYWKLAAPLVQLFIGFGTFRLMRGMGSLPVPGLETGGFLWLHDLTLSDPYCILPVVTAFAFYSVMKLGNASGTLIDPRIRFVLTYVMPTITGAFMLAWPGALQLSFCTTSLFSVLQGYLLRSDPFRDWAGVMRMPVAAQAPTDGPSPSPYSGKLTLSSAQKPQSAPPAPTSSGNKVKGIIDGAISDVKGAASEAVKLGKQYSGTEVKPGKRSATERKEAEDYEAKRKKELEREGSAKRRTRELAQESKLAKWQRKRANVARSKKGGR